MKAVNKTRPPASLLPAVIVELSETNQKLVGKNEKLALYEELLQIKKERNRKNIALRPLLFNIGMTLSLVLVILAINWKSYSTGSLIDLGEVQNDITEIIDIPISKQPPPPPPKQDLFKIEEVSNKEVVEELQINLDVEVVEETALEEIEITDFVIEEVVEEIFIIVEQEPTPQGGINEFYSYLAKEINYPATAVRLGISGTVYVQFVIEKDGSITQVTMVRGIGAGCDEEAVRVLENAPPWNPGKQRGTPVRVKKIIPVRFILHE